MVRKQDWSPREPAWKREIEDAERAYLKWMQHHGITMSSGQVDSNPNLADPDSDWARDASHWRIVFRRDRTPKSFSVYYSMGSAHTGPPDAPGVLDSMRSDAGSFDDAGTFEDWARSMGLDADSRKAEAIWKHVKAQTERLKRFLGDEIYREFENLPGL